MKLERAQEIIQRFSEKRVLVIGDVMLDQYLWGTAARISPEAPVPVVTVEKRTTTPGGAGNVALNLAGLGCSVEIAGVIGDDEEGRILTGLFNNRAISTAGLRQIHRGKTTVKTRVIAQDQQVVRIDQENMVQSENNFRSQILQHVETCIDGIDGIILEDYNKGLLTGEMIASILEISSKNKVNVYVDPKKDNFDQYRNVRLFKPNKKEFLEGTGVQYNGIDFNEAGRRFRKRSGIEILVVTRGPEGISVFTETGQVDIPTRARKVHDVSGAGDTVISLFSLADLAGASCEEAAELANYGAGRVCEEVGVVPINIEMLSGYLQSHNSR